MALFGTGASGIQCVPPLAESAKQLFVFQRTPSAIGERGNRLTDPRLQPAGLEPGWQRARMDNFQGTHHGTARGRRPGGRRVDPRLRPSPGMSRVTARSTSIEEYLRRAEEVDFQIMEAHRRRVEELVARTRPPPRSSSLTTVTCASAPASTTSICPP